MTQTTPHSIEAERAILSIAFRDPALIDELAEYVSDAAFYAAAHGEIWAALVSTFRDGGGVDAVRVASLLSERGKLASIGGANYIADMVDYMPTTAGAMTHARKVADTYRRRQLIAILTGLLESGYAPGLDAQSFSDNVLAAIVNATREQGESGAVTVHDVLVETFEEARAAAQGEVSAVPTPWVDLNSEIMGLVPSTLTLVAGRPSMGKTAFALNMVTHAAIKSGVPSVFFSLESGRKAIGRRIVASEAAIPLGGLRRGELTDHQWVKATTAAGEIGRAPILIDDTTGLTAETIASRTRRLHAQGKCGLIVIDHAQEIKASGRREKRGEEVSDSARIVRNLSRDLNIPVVLLAQLNRECEKRQNKRPVNSDLKESGTLEEVADVILFPYRDAVYNASANPHDAEIIIGKNRDGSCGLVNLTWTGASVKFADRLPAEWERRAGGRP